MRRKVIFFNPPVISSGGGGGGELQQTVQINLGDGTWNTAIVSGWFRYCANESSSISNITNSDDTNTGWSLSRPAAVNGVGEGVTATSTDTGFPIGVTEKLMGNGTNGTFTFSSLNDSYTYEFDFFASQTRTWESAAGTTTYDINGDSVYISHSNYYGDVVTLSGISPSSGEISIDVTKGNGASNWYLSNIVVREYN